MNVIIITPPPLRVAWGHHIFSSFQQTDGLSKLEFNDIVPLEPELGVAAALVFVHIEVVLMTKVVPSPLS